MQRVEPAALHLALLEEPPQASGLALSSYKCPWSLETLGLSFLCSSTDSLSVRLSLSLQQVSAQDTGGPECEETMEASGLF